MKKILILCICFLLSGCGVASKEIQDIQEFNISTQRLYDVNFDFVIDGYNIHRKRNSQIIDISENYVYVCIQFEDEHCYKYYRIDKSGYRNLMYTLYYSNEYQLYNHSLINAVVDDMLIINYIDLFERKTELLFIKEDHIEYIYDADKCAWLMSATKDYVILNERNEYYSSQNDNVNVENYIHYNKNYKNDIIKVDLKSYEKEVILNADFRVDKDTGEIIGNYIFGFNQITEDGFVYKDVNNIYFYDLSSHSDIIICSNENTYGNLVGNKNLLFAYDYSEDRLVFYERNNNRYKQSYLSLRKCMLNTSVYKDIYINNNEIYLSLIDSVIIYNNARLNVFRFNDSKTNGEYLFFNDKIYYVEFMDSHLYIDICEVNEIK